MMLIIKSLEEFNNNGEIKKIDVFILLINKKLKRRYKFSLKIKFFRWFSSF